MYSVQRIVTDDTSQLFVVEEMPWRIERERADATEHTNIVAAAIPERRTDFGFVSGWVVPPDSVQYRDTAKDPAT